MNEKQVHTSKEPAVSHNEPFDIKNRRPDILVKSVPWFAVAAWLIFIVSLILIGLAKPQVETMFDRYYEVQLSASWDRQLLLFNYRLLWALSIFCANGILVNSLRQKRKDDRYSKSLIIISIFSVLGIIAYHLFLI